MDRRTKRQKLEAMANQSVSPHEADVARRKLADLPPEPPRPVEHWALGAPPVGTTYAVRVNVMTNDLARRFFEELMEAMMEEMERRHD